jgi:hypothetical protein
MYRPSASSLARLDSKLERHMSEGELAGEAGGRAGGWWALWSGRGRDWGGAGRGGAVPAGAQAWWELQPSVPAGVAGRGVDWGRGGVVGCWAQPGRRGVRVRAACLRAACLRAAGRRLTGPAAVCPRPPQRAPRSTCRRWTSARGSGCTAPPATPSGTAGARARPPAWARGKRPAAHPAPPTAHCLPAPPASRPPASPRPPCHPNSCLPPALPPAHLPAHRSPAHTPAACLPAQQGRAGGGGRRQRRAQLRGPAAHSTPHRPAEHGERGGDGGGHPQLQRALLQDVAVAPRGLGRHGGGRVGARGGLAGAQAGRPAAGGACVLVCGLCEGQWAPETSWLAGRQLLCVRVRVRRPARGLGRRPAAWLAADQQGCRAAAERCPAADAPRCWSRARTCGCCARCPPRQCRRCGRSRRTGPRRRPRASRAQVGTCSRSPATAAVPQRAQHAAATRCRPPQPRQPMHPPSCCSHTRAPLPPPPTPQRARSPAAWRAPRCWRLAGPSRGR